jgi:undecaprenyl-diphosphatase
VLSLSLAEATVVAADAASQASDTAAVLALAVLQGLTEFLPISSSGHLVLGRELLGMQAGGLALDVALHVGTLVAVVVAYAADLRKLVLDVLRGKWRFALWIVLASVPAGVIGVTAGDQLELAFQSPKVAGIGLLVSACILSMGEWLRRRNERLAVVRDPADRPGLADALAIGLLQAAALVPGISRSGSTIGAGLLRHFDARQAARLSFLISVPAVLGAALLKIPDALEAGFGGLSLGLVGAAVALSAVVGWLSLKLLLLVLARGAFAGFAVYCASVGLLALAFL